MTNLLLPGPVEFITSTYNKYENDHSNNGDFK